jgi:hypothetical protein
MEKRAFMLAVLNTAVMFCSAIEHSPSIHINNYRRYVGVEGCAKLIVFGLSVLLCALL